MASVMVSRFTLGALEHFQLFGNICDLHALNTLILIYDFAARWNTDFLLALSNQLPLSLRGRREHFVELLSDPLFLHREPSLPDEPAYVVLGAFLAQGHLILRELDRVVHQAFAVSAVLVCTGFYLGGLYHRLSHLSYGQIIFIRKLNKLIEGVDVLFMLDVL